jgi:endonuclease/exonuclease/phosphatase family metal-dependent hydrolase
MFSFRIATYNVHKCRGLDRSVRPHRIAAVLKQTSADIIALQEVVSVSDSQQRERDQARFIAEELGMFHCVGENRRLHGGSYGNVLLSRFPIRYTHNYDITWRGREPRGCLRADVEVDSTVLLHVFNIHLGTAFVERRYQGRQLVSPGILCDETLRGARLVVGDFNEWTRGLASRLLAAEFESVDIRRHLRRTRTYPGPLPLLHLDHIYFSSSLQLERLTLHKSLTALVASDHLPMVADFRLR